MKLFASTDTKRKCALSMLLVWLFALASGIANGCILETPESHSREEKGMAATTSHAPDELVALLGTDACHHNGSDSTKESCLKVCDDGTLTLPKAYSGVDHADLGSAPLVATLWTGLPAVIPALRRHDLAEPKAAPPLRVRYSRLAL